MKSLGIIGGLGPMATAYLLQLIIEMTDAKTDQEHLDVIVFDRPSVPDRTSTLKSPLPCLPCSKLREHWNSWELAAFVRPASPLTIFTGNLPAASPSPFSIC